jgi:hypothetical protein
MTLNTSEGWHIAVTFNSRLTYGMAHLGGSKNSRRETGSNTLQAAAKYAVGWRE